MLRKRRGRRPGAILSFRSDVYRRLASVPPLEGAASMQLLYKGFNQRANIRSYRFDGVLPSERPTRIVKNLEFLLKIDMTVLAEHRIRIQEAPALCLGILQTALATPGADTVPFVSYTITRAEILAFASARDAVQEAKGTRRKHRPPFKPTTPAQWKWPGQ
jgi:hypothetical protein